MATKVPSKKTAPKKMPLVFAEVAETYPRPQYVFPEQKIVKLAKSNPSREGTKANENWKIIRSGMSVALYLARGGSIKDLRKNLSCGNVEIN